MKNNNNKKENFFIADICKITEMKETTDTNNNLYTRYYYELIDKKIVYYKNKYYIDIETNKKYHTTYNNIGDTFIKIGSIIPFSDYLKTNRINHSSNDINSKRKVKKLYNEYKKIG